MSLPGKVPLSIMKGRLTAELKKGEAIRVVRVAPGVWAVPVAAPAAPAVEQAAPQPELTDEEKALSALYGDDLTPAPAAAAHAEYRDAQTADEDRPKRREVLPPRDRRGRSGRRERDRGRRGKGREAKPDRKAEARGDRKAEARGDRKAEARGDRQARTKGDRKARARDDRKAASEPGREGGRPPGGSVPARGPARNGRPARSGWSPA